jgi:acetyl esterase/lipase
VADINYILTEKSEPTFRYQEQLYDVVKSIEFLVGCGATITNGTAQLVRRYDNSNIVLMGHSAGGHMSVGAVITNLRHIRNHVRAVIGLQGLYDMITYYEDFPSFVDMFETVFGRDRVLKSGSTEISVMLDGSPTRLILAQHALQDAIKIHIQQYDALYPPTSSGESDQKPVQNIRFLIVHSPQDTWVNPKQSEEVCAALKDTYPGVHVEYDHRPYGDHWEVVQSLQKKEIVDMYVRFINHKE